MPLRHPRYLNRDDFYAHADYHGLEIPYRVEVTARTSTNRSGGAKVGFPTLGLGVEGQVGNGVELQSAYVLEVSEKSSFSKVLDIMEEEGESVLTALPSPQGGDQRWETDRDQLVELAGSMKLSPVSSIGKIMNVALQLMADEDVDLDQIISRPTAKSTLQGAEGGSRDLDDIPAQVQAVLKAMYLRNEIPEIPTLFRLEVDDDEVPWSVFVNCEPGHFIGSGAAATDSIEGDVTVVGVVKQFVSDNPSDGFISTEPWTLHGWERTLRTMVRTRMDDLITSLIPHFDSEWKPGNETFHIKGPAILIDAVAIF